MNLLSPCDDTRSLWNEDGRSEMENAALVEGTDFANNRFVEDKLMPNNSLGQGGENSCNMRFKLGREDSMEDGNIASFQEDNARAISIESPRKLNAGMSSSSPDNMRGIPTENSIEAEPGIKTSKQNGEAIGNDRLHGGSQYATQHYVNVTQMVESWREELKLINVKNAIILDDLVKIGADM